MKVNLLIIKNVAMGFTDIVADVHTMVTGKTIKCMVKEFIHGQMVDSTRESIFVTSKWAMEL